MRLSEFEVPERGPAGLGQVPEGRDLSIPSGPPREIGGGVNRAPGSILETAIGGDLWYTHARIAHIYLVGDLSRETY